MTQVRGKIQDECHVFILSEVKQIKYKIAWYFETSLSLINTDEARLLRMSLSKQQWRTVEPRNPNVQISALFVMVWLLNRSDFRRLIIDNN